MASVPVVSRPAQVALTGAWVGEGDGAAGAPVVVGAAAGVGGSSFLLVVWTLSASSAAPSVMPLSSVSSGVGFTVVSQCVFGPVVCVLVPIAVGWWGVVGHVWWGVCGDS